MAESTKIKRTPAEDIGGIRSRVGQEDYASAENNLRGAVDSTESGVSPFRTSTRDYEDERADLTTGNPDIDTPFESVDTLTTTATDSDIESTPEIEATKAQIEQTRAEMSSTIDAIKEKLSPAHLVEEAKEATLGAAHDAVANVVDSVKDKAASVVDFVKEKAGIVADHAKDAAHTVADKVHQVTGSKDATSSVPTYSAYTTPSAVPVTRRPSSPSAYGTSTTLGASIVDSIKINPLPAALAGFGIGWLLISIQRQQKDAALTGPRSFPVPADATPSGYLTTGSSTFGTAPTGSGTLDGLRDKASDLALGVADRATGLAQTVSDKASTVAHSVSDKASDVAQTVSDKASDLKGRATQFAGDTRDKAGDLAHTVRDKAGDLAESTKGQYRAASDHVDQFIDAQPLVAGAIALVVGAAIGFLLPSTSKENELLGPHRDRLVDQAGEAVHNVAVKAQTVAESALGQAKESLGQTVDQAKESLGTAVDKAKETVKTEVKNQGLDAPATAIAS